MARSRSKQRTLPPDHYFIRSQQPLPSLVFLLPLVLFYEAGVFYWLGPSDMQLAARNYLARTLDWFGAAGHWLPALAVVGVLISWHIARRDPWRFEPRVYIAMAFESLGLAIPLLLLGLLTGSGSSSAILGPALSSNPLLEMPLRQGLVLAVGAGVYEELVFRLAAIALIHMLLVDLLKVPELRGATIAIIVSAALFALAHFNQNAEFHLASWAFLFAAGVYFAVIYIIRGFGIVAATHALYDVLLVGLSWAMSGRH